MPVFAESPDHAAQLQELSGLKQRVSEQHREIDVLTARLQQAEGRASAAELGSAHSGRKRPSVKRWPVWPTLGDGLRGSCFSHGLPPKREPKLTGWYADVCRALSKPLCTAFMTAPSPGTSWVNDPLDDGGYQHNLRGRTAFLGSHIAGNCGK